jgi:hypothetical protein
MLSLFDLLPVEDILHETIMPMLDYESRIVLNRCLPPNERYRTQFSVNDIVRHELCVVSKLLKQKLDNIYNVTGRTRTLRMKKKSQLILTLLHCFEPGNRCVLMLQNYPSFHHTVVQKLISLSNPRSDDMRDASRYFRRMIVKHANALLPYIQTIVPLPVPMQGILKPIEIQGL